MHFTRVLIVGAVKEHVRGKGAVKPDKPLREILLRQAYRVADGKMGDGIKSGHKFSVHLVRETIACRRRRRRHLRCGNFFF